MKTLPGLMGRKVKTSDDYVAEIVARRGGDGSQSALTSEQKRHKMGLILQDEQDGVRKLGVGMVGPIQLRLRYQGVVRNVLVEDAIQPGTPTEYEVWDDLGQAYMMSPTEGEVRITPFEGKRIVVYPFRVASFPAVRKEDLQFLRLNAVEQAQDESKQAIMKQEDQRLFVLLTAAQSDYAGRPDHDVTPNHNVIETSGYFTPQSMWKAAALVAEHELRSGRIIAHVADAYDFNRWDINTTGWAFKDRQVAGETITQFGEFQFQRSIMAPKGKLFLTPEPNFLGIMPLWQSLEVEENHKVEAFWRGWVMDELIGQVILNPRGIASITKA